MRAKWEETMAKIFPLFLPVAPAVPMAPISIPIDCSVSSCGHSVRNTHIYIYISHVVLDFVTLSAVFKPQAAAVSRQDNGREQEKKKKKSQAA